jgi:hypothetical protein
VLLLTDYIMPIGSILLGQLIAVLEAEQTEGKKKQRNDRLIAIPSSYSPESRCNPRSSSTPF